MVGVAGVACSSLVSWVWHVCVHVCVHAYIHTHAHVQCSSWEGLCVAERKPGSIGSGGTAHSNRSSSFGVSVSGMLCLVRCGWEGFLGIG